MRTTVLLLVAFMIASVSCTPVPTRPAAAAATLTAAPPPPPLATPDTCNYVRQPTPNPAQPSLFPPVSPQDHVRGPADAYLTVLLYSDFQCPACAKFAALLASIQLKYPQEVRIVYRDFPLKSVNDKAVLADQAAEAASLQGKFWEMHDLLFAKQAEWTALDALKFQAWLVNQAATLGLDTLKFHADLTSPAIAAIPAKAWQDGLKMQLPGVPLILLNGQILRSQLTLLSDLESIIRLDLLAKRQFTNCPPYTIDATKQYQATLKTAKGNIVIRLFPDKAPNTVNNFVFLAKAGWYDNISFYRVVPGFIAQTGDPSGTGQGNPGYFIPNELTQAMKFDRPGLVGMNNSGPDTNGSQFFITSNAIPNLNGTYTLFGQVISGMDVLQKLTARDPKPGDNLPDGDLLMTVQIEEK